MLEVIIALGGGILLSRFGHNRFPVKRISGYLTSASAFALLFCMGLGIGSDPRVLQNLPQLGGQALLLSLAAVAGGFLCCLPLAMHLLGDTNKVSIVDNSSIRKNEPHDAENTAQHAANAISGDRQNSVQHAEQDAKHLRRQS